MTELEARRILREHASECPSFVRRRHLYKVRRDGRVDIYRGNPRTDRWVYEHTVAADWIGLRIYPEIRDRAMEAAA